MVNVTVNGAILNLIPDEMETDVAYLVEDFLVEGPCWVYKTSKGEIVLVLTVEEDAEYLLKERPEEYKRPE